MSSENKFLITDIIGLYDAAVNAHSTVVHENRRLAQEVENLRNAVAERDSKIIKVTTAASTNAQASKNALTLAKRCMFMVKVTKPVLEYISPELKTACASFNESKIDEIVNAIAESRERLYKVNVSIAKELSEREKRWREQERQMRDDAKAIKSVAEKRRVDRDSAIRYSEECRRARDQARNQRDELKAKLEAVESECDELKAKRKSVDDEEEIEPAPKRIKSSIVQFVPVGSTVEYRGVERTVTDIYISETLKVTLKLDGFGTNVGFNAVKPVIVLDGWTSFRELPTEIGAEVQLLHKPPGIVNRIHMDQSGLTVRVEKNGDYHKILQ